MKNINKILITGIIVISIIFISVNLMWIVYLNSYKPLVEGYENLEKLYMKKMGDYTLTIKQPQYLSFKGNFAISDLDISLIIWPDFKKKENCGYGLIIYDVELKHGYRFYVDNNLNYIEEGNNEFDEKEVVTIQKLLVKYSDKLKQMRDVAFEEWKL